MLTLKKFSILSNKGQEIRLNLKLELNFIFECIDLNRPFLSLVFITKILALTLVSINIKNRASAFK